MKQMTRNALYMLKKQEGVKATRHHPVSTTVDLETGVISRVFLSDTVRRAIPFMLPISKEFSYDLSFIAANKNFTYGGLFVRDKMGLAIDSRDLSLGFSVTPDDEIDVFSKRWRIARHAEDIVNKYLILELHALRIEGAVLGDNPIMAPDVLTGTAAIGQTIVVNDLVFQDQSDIYLASNDNEDRPALGMVFDIIGNTIYHRRLAVFPALIVLGTPDPVYPQIWLGLNGKPTFDKPSDGVQQQVGFSAGSNGDGTYEVSINITHNVTLV